MPIDPIDSRVLTLGLQPQARTPYDAPDLVAERRARVEQLREQQKQKQEAEYDNQLYDWAIKSNLGPDGTPDIDGVRKSLYSVAPRTALKFDDVVTKAKKAVHDEKDAALKTQSEGLGVFARVAQGATADNWATTLPILKHIDANLAARLPDQYDKASVDAAIQSGLTTNDFLSQQREALKFYADNKPLLGAAQQIAALPDDPTDSDVAGIVKNWNDHGGKTIDLKPMLDLKTEQLKPWADNLLKGPKTIAELQAAGDRDAATEANRQDVGLRAAQTAEETHRHNVELEKAAQARAKRPVGGAGAQGAGGGLTPDAVDYVATQYRILGPSGMPTRISEADRTAVLNKSAEQIKLLGQSPAIAVQRQAAYKGDADSLKKMKTMASAAEAFETKANQQADIVNELSGKVGRTGSPMLNSWLLAGKKEVVGDTDTALLYNAIQTFSTEYAKIMEGSTGSAAGSSDSARKASENLIKAAMAPATIPKVVSLMQREMALTRTGYDATIEHITNRMGGTVPPEAGGGAPTTKMLRFGNNAPFQVTKQPDGTWKSDSGGIYDDRGTRIK